MVLRTIDGKSTYVFVVISPEIMARPVVTSVSQATRPRGSSARHASRIASEIWSAILSGWPSVTDSDVNKNFSREANGLPPKISCHLYWDTLRILFKRLPKESTRRQRLGVTTGGNAAEWGVFHGEMGRQPCYRSKSMG